MQTVRCKHRLPGPEVAGARDLDTLKLWAVKYPNMCPCERKLDSRGGRNWTYRKYCGKCPNGVGEGEE